jgi:hypothetical protein
VRFRSGRVWSVLGLAVTPLVLAACASGLRPRSDFPGTWVRRQGIALSVPRGFRQYKVPGDLGLLVADYSVKRGASGAFYKWSDFKAPPVKRTALQVERWIPFGPGGPNTRLHLPLSLGQRWQVEQAGNGTAGYRYGAFVLHGQTYKVFVWNGPSAPPRDRFALVHALASLRADT